MVLSIVIILFCACGYYLLPRAIADWIILGEVDGSSHKLALNTSAQNPNIFRVKKRFVDRVDFSVNQEHSLTTGYAALIISRTGDYTFKAVADDGVWVFIDGDPIITQTRFKSKTANSSTVKLYLEKGHHLLVFKLYNGTGRGSLKLLYAGGTDELAVITKEDINYIDLANINEWLKAIEMMRKGSFILFWVYLVLCIGGTVSYVLYLHIKDAAEPGNRVTCSKYIVGSVLTASLTLFILRYLSSDMGSDAAVCGIMALSILDGHLPVFYFGQDFLGAVDSYLLAPLLWAFGPSSLILNIFPLISVLAAIIILFKALNRQFGCSVGLPFLLINAFPSFLVLYWAGEARNQYPLLLLFASIIIYISVVLYQKLINGPDAKRIALYWFAFGLVCGLAIWTNYLSLVVIGFCYPLLALYSLKKKKLLSFLLFSSIGLALGLAPLIWYKLGHGGVSMLLNPHPAEDGYELGNRLDYLLINAIPVAMGLNPRLSYMEHIRPLILTLFILPSLFGVSLFIKSRNPFYLLPLATMCLNIAAVMVGGRGAFELRHLEQRYLLIISLVSFPLSISFLIQSLSRYGKPLVYIACTAVVFIHVFHYDTRVKERGGFWGGGRLIELEKGYHRTTGLGIKQRIDELQNAGVHSLYSDRNSYAMSFLAGDKVTVSHFSRTRCLPLLTKVDAAIQVGFSSEWAKSFNLLGREYKHRAGAVVSGPYQLDKRAVSCAFVDHWVEDNHGKPWGRVFDNSLATAYWVDPPRRGDGITVHFKHSMPLSGIALVNDSSRTYSGDLTIEVMGPDGGFKRVAHSEGAPQPLYVSGPRAYSSELLTRQDIYFEKVEARAVRIIYNREKGPRLYKISELYLYQDSSSPPQVDWNQARQTLLQAAGQANGLPILADSWASSVIYRHYGGKVDCTRPNSYANPYGAHRRLSGNLFPISRTRPSLLITDDTYYYNILKQLNKYQFRHTTRRQGIYHLITVAPRYGPPGSEPQIRLKWVSDRKAELHLDGGRLDSVKHIVLESSSAQAGPVKISKIELLQQDGSARKLDCRVLHELGYGGLGVFEVKSGDATIELKPAALPAKAGARLLVTFESGGASRSGLKASWYR